MKTKEHGHHQLSPILVGKLVTIWLCPSAKHKCKPGNTPFDPAALQLLWAPVGSFCCMWSRVLCGCPVEPGEKERCDKLSLLGQSYTILNLCQLS